jgi:hypothetical protein
VATPFICALTLDVHRASVVRLANTFLAPCQDSATFPLKLTCGDNFYSIITGSGNAEEKWLEEARFTGPHELGMCLRWGRICVFRVEDGRDMRRLLSRA